MTNERVIELHRISLARRNDLPIGVALGHIWVIARRIGTVVPTGGRGIFALSVGVVIWVVAVFLWIIGPHSTTPPQAATTVVPMMEPLTTKSAPVESSAAKSAAVE